MNVSAQYVIDADDILSAEYAVYVRDAGGCIFIIHELLAQFLE